MKELELDIDDLKVRHVYLDVRLIVKYRFDPDGGFAYSSIVSGDAKSKRRDKWVPIPNLTDEIYNTHWGRIEDAILEQELDRGAMDRELRCMKREYEREETAALRRELGA